APRLDWALFGSTRPLKAKQTHFFATLAREEVDAVHEADPVAARAHDERVRARAVGEVADAAQQFAVGNPGGRDDRLARREVVDREDALRVVDSVLAELVDLAPRRRPELPLQLAAEAAKRGGCEHGLAGAADPDREVVVRAADRSGDRRGHVAVLDELDARAGVADLLDQIMVTRAVEDDRRHVVHPPPERLGDRLDVVADRAEEV